MKRQNRDHRAQDKMRLELVFRESIRGKFSIARHTRTLRSPLFRRSAPIPARCDSAPARHRCRWRERHISHASVDASPDRTFPAPGETISRHMGDNGERRTTIAKLKSLGRSCELRDESPGLARCGEQFEAGAGDDRQRSLSCRSAASSGRSRRRSSPPGRRLYLCGRRRSRSECRCSSRAARHSRDAAGRRCPRRQQSADGGALRERRHRQQTAAHPPRPSTDSCATVQPAPMPTVRSPGS